MTKDEFRTEFRRLCDGFSYQPKPTQMEAFYERLQHCHPDDWREAVTDLLCAPKFPRDLNAILQAVDVRAEQRRKIKVSHEHIQAVRTMTTLGLSMREALADRPDLLEKMERLMKSECSKGAA